MNRILVLSSIASILFAVPLGGATDPFAPGYCDENVGCLSPLPCVSDVYCQASVCDPGLQCHGRAATYDDCAVNTTIQGETCQTSASGEAYAARNVPGTDLGVGATGAGADIALTQGDAELLDLQNTWISHGATVRGSAGGISLGETSVHVYRSVIQLDERDDTSLLGIATADGNRTFSEISVVAHHTSPAAEQSIVVAVLTLDHMPEGCFVRSSDASAPTYTCMFPELPLA